MIVTNHDRLCEILSTKILEKFPRLFGKVFIANVSIDFPRPDFVYIPVDISTYRKRITPLLQKDLIGKTLPLPVSFEVKTPTVDKHEYITGIGQSICYNSFFPLSYLVIPDKNIDEFNVEEFISRVTKINNLPIGIFVYKKENVEEIKKVKEASVNKKLFDKQIMESIKNIKRSYSYWRETSPEEVFWALQISRDLEKLSRSNILEDVIDRLWNEILSKRFKKASKKSSFLLNYKLFLIQNALLDANGKLTSIGKHTLLLGNDFGPDSDVFQRAITYILLKYGGHYILLSKIYEIQETIGMKNDWNSWAQEVSKRLAQQNYYISTDDFRIDWPRLPYAYENYFCGIAKDGFKEGKGKIIINYPKIVEIMEEGARLYSPVESTLSF